MTKSTRQKVKERAKYVCEYCFSVEYFSPDPFEIEHIIAASKGGTNDMNNLALACSGCNGYKGDTIQAIDPASGHLTALYHPRNDSWETHFCWNENFDTLIGISPLAGQLSQNFG